MTGTISGSGQLGTDYSTLCEICLLTVDRLKPPHMVSTAMLSTLIQHSCGQCRDVVTLIHRGLLLQRHKTKSANTIRCPCQPPCQMMYCDTAESHPCSACLFIHSQQGFANLTTRQDRQEPDVCGPVLTHCALKSIVHRHLSCCP